MRKRRAAEIFLVCAIPLIVLFLVIVAPLIGSAFRIQGNSSSQECKSFQSTTTYFDIVKGYKPVCGTGSASDGRLNITLRNFFYSDFAHLNLSTGSGNVKASEMEVLLIANVSIANIGNGNASVTGGFYIALENTTISASNASVVSNGLYEADATFSRFPHQSLQVAYGDTNLFPGQTMYCRLIFIVPYPALSLNETHAVLSLRLLQFMYLENVYGGAYEGGGQYVGSVQFPNVEFIVTPVSSYTSICLSDC